MISYFEHRVLSVSGRPTGPKKLMSELQTEREFNVDAGCSVVITSLSGEELLKREITETTRLTLLKEILKRDLIQSAAARLKVPEEVLEESDSCKLFWEELSSTNLRGFSCLESMSSEAYNKVYARFHRLPACSVCFDACEPAESKHVSSRNCVRCEPYLLCPLCKVYINGQPVCYVCIGDEDRENDTLRLPDDVRQRIDFLKGCTGSDSESDDSSGF